MVSALCCFAVFSQAAGLTETSTGKSGGFTGPGPSVTTVKEALGLRDDAVVTLRGNIVQYLGKDLYLFKDSTGTVNVDIDSDIWRGQNVSPKDTVEITGEVDKDWLSLKIDVQRLTKP
ncbi:MAG: YgiW/YdeI family stress tolerance OB fold protein [Desulfovibrio sp.]|nr:YgiW/YdeI family stress tolerance OB fold protein [Desulfovibrio sp.]